MTTHLSPEELIDLAEGILEPSRVAHVTECSQCRDEAADLGRLAAEARQVEVPEPSVLFWPELATRIATSTASGRESAAPRWSFWTAGRMGAVAATILLLAMVVVGLSMRRSLTTPHGARATLAEPIPGDDSNGGDEAAWALLLTVAEAADWDDADTEPWLVDSGAIDGAVAQLSAAERQDLVRLLEAELEGSS